MRQEVREQCHGSAHILPGRPKPDEILEIVTFAAISALFEQIESSLESSDPGGGVQHPLSAFGLNQKHRRCPCLFRPTHQLLLYGLDQVDQVCDGAYFFLLDGFLGYAIEGILNVKLQK
jgi:hypothetical protein